MSITIRLAVVACLFAAAAWPARANLIVNGSFEDPQVAYLYVPGGVPGITGWETIHSGAELFNPNIYSAGPAQDGNLLVDINTDFGIGGGVRQSFATTPGQSYQLSFYGGTWFGHGRNGTGNIQVSVGNVSQSYTVTSSVPTIVWTQFTLTFQATSSSTTLTFENFENFAETFALIDNVSVEPLADPDEDDDGVPDPDDSCPGSDLGATVVIDGCDTGVTNGAAGPGCTVSDLIGQCAAGASNHGEFMRCVSRLTNDLKSAGVITGKQKGAIESCAARADIP